MGEKYIFIRNFMKNPRQIGSIIPSSKRLANKMVEQINFKEAKFIVELGPGVGCFTKEIMGRKNNDTKFIVFEKNEDMREIIKNKFSGIEIYNKAEELTQVLEDNKFINVDHIISGLPFTVLEKDIREQILEQVYNNLEAGGKFITFQYSLDLYKYLKKTYNKVELKIVLLNIPMAYVYVCTK